MKRKLHKFDDEADFEFYKYPYEVFKQPQYRHVNSTARLIYMLILDRLAVSIQKGWADDNGKVFVILSRQEAMELLGITSKTASKAFQQLVNTGLIVEKRRGQGLPNLIFVRRLPQLECDLDEPEKQEKSASDSVIQETLETPEANLSKTYLN